MPVVFRESLERRQAREQRQHLDEITTQLFFSWRTRQDDPFAVELLRGVALAYLMDADHPVDRRGRCKRWRCTRGWRGWSLTRRRCPTRLTLSFCRTADTATLWFRVLNRLVPTLQISFASVRDWLEQCQASKSETDESTIVPNTVE
jgi:hypothetical protein